jgi:S-DNA-T family DNA segregation ATPase FtsK/SpoIIIE
MSDRPGLDASRPRAVRCWTLRTRDGALDVELTASDRDTVGSVATSLSRELGVSVQGLWSGSTRLAENTELAAAELVHGAVLGLEGPVPRSSPADRSSAVELHVVGGPDAGRTAPLDQGRHVVGRGTDATLRIDDPDVSRRHVAVRVGGGAIGVADLGSTNGSRLDGEELGAEFRTWPAGAVLRIGASALAVTGPGGPAAVTEPHRDGRAQLRPTPRMSAPPPEVEVTFPGEPVAAPRRRLAWVAVALPGVAGVAMSWVLQTPTFLFFALLSPVVALGTWLSDRWSGRRTGRRERAAYAVLLLAAEKRLAAAVLASVRIAEAGHPDLATLTTAARRRSGRLWSRRLTDAEALSVRLGSGPGETTVQRVHPNGTRLRAPAPQAPVAVDLRRTGGLAVVGPRERAVGVLTSVVAQLATLHPPGDVDFLLLADADRLHDWAWARWLPHLPPVAVHVGTSGAGDVRRQEDQALNTWLSALAAGRRSGGADRPGTSTSAVPMGWLVVVVDRPVDPRVAATLHGARDAGVLILTTAETVGDVPVAVDAALRLTGETGDVAVLSREGLPDRDGIVIDRLSRAAATALSRDLAGLAPVASAGSLPANVRLLDLPAGGVRIDAEGRAIGAWSRDRDRLVATLGRTAEGPLEIDLCRLGPHALVAGTTGSGKSELLQTLIAGLALRHPPDRCSFLLVDYKGGAAFAEAADLPHTVGLLTDLDGRTTARALRSLTAELTRREAILSHHEVPDIAALPEGVPLARLVIVVDEFATLAEELPEFIGGLVSIAQRGRSLGVHLILATQRPGGVVSPEIRANCTLRICLRTTDEADSRDVLGGIEAAHLPVDRPGRAYLRAGSGPSAALQVARVATAPPSTGTTGPQVRRWAWPFPARRVDAEPASDGSDLGMLVQALTRHAASSGTPAPHRPWRPPLPDRLGPEPDDTAAHGRSPADTRLRLGLMDLPDRQAQEALELDLGRGGGWLAVGGPRSGRTTLLRTVLAEAVSRVAPSDLHVHVIDASGGALAAEVARVPHTGTSIGGPDALRTVRLVERLAHEVADRRAGAAGAGPLILLLIDGVDAVSALLDEAEPARGSAALLRLVRDGAAAGVTCVLTADRAVPGGRLAAAVRQRIVLPLPDRADYAMAGIPARAVPAHRPPGRALIGEDSVECQLALPRPLDGRWGTPPAGRPPATPALRIVDLAPDPVLPLPAIRASAPEDGDHLPLPLGPGGDEGAPLVVDLLRTGGLLVTGPPASGRSSALDAFAQHLQALGTPLLRIGGPPHGTGSTAVPPTAAWVEAEDRAGTVRWLEDHGARARVVIADDVGAPGEAPALDALPALGRRSGVALLAAGSAGQLAGHYQGPVLHLRRSRSGLLLCPGSGDADVLGLRLPRMPLPLRPGSGWLVAGSLLERVQVARRRQAPSAGIAP